MKTKKQVAIGLFVVVVLLILVNLAFMHFQTREYELTQIYTSTVEEFLEFFDNDKYAEQIYYDETSGIVRVIATGKQRNNWIIIANKNIEDLSNINELGMPIGIMVNNDRTRMEMHWSKQEAPMFATGWLMYALSAVEWYQVFGGKDRFECQLVFYDTATGEIVLECTFPGESFEITPEIFSE